MRRIATVPVELAKIRAKVKEIASTILKNERIDDVLVETDVDHMDRDALRITVVLKDHKKLKVEGEAAVSTIVATSDFLIAGEDERFPHVRFVTTKELAELNEGND